MSEARGKTYRPWNPEHYRHEVHSPEAKLPQADLVFFLLDTVPHLDLSRFYAPYEEEPNSVRLNFCTAAELSDASGQYGRSIPFPWPSH